VKVPPRMIHFSYSHIPHSNFDRKSILSKRCSILKPPPVRSGIVIFSVSIVFNHVRPISCSSLLYMTRRPLIEITKACRIAKAKSLISFWRDPDEGFKVACR
jgi:hypothetical protein